MRDYIKEQIRMFVEDYHIDGFRWDSVYNIRYASGTWNQTGNDMLAEINNWLINYHPDLFRISEDHAFDTDVGFEAQWDHGFLNDIRYLATAANDADRNMDTLAGYLRDTGLDRVVYPESHDSCGDLNSKNRLPYDINSGDPAGYYAKKRALLANTIAMVSPGIPMIFEGSEMHEWYQFSDGTALRWSLTNTYAGLVKAYGDLIHLRRNVAGHTAALKNANNVNVHHVNNTGKVVGMIRWDQGGQTDDIVVAINCSATAYGSYGMAFPSAGTWTCLYNSDSTNYNADFGNVGPAVGGTIDTDGSANATLALGAYSMQIYYKAAAVPSSVSFDPVAPSGCGSEVTLTYSPGDGVLSGATPVYAYIGQNNWQNPASNLMTAAGSDWTLDYTIPADTYELNIVFTDGAGTWDNNGGSDWKVAVSDCGTPPVGTETEYWRGDAGLNNNWANTDASGINNWWRAGDGWTVRRPDLASNAWSATGVRSYNTVIIDNDQRTAMAVNNDTDTGGAEFQVHQILFANFADRSLTQGNGAYLKMGGGTNNAKIEATSPNGTGTYTFNVPLLLDKTTELNPVGGNLAFNAAITNGGYGIEVYGNNGKTLAIAGGISGAGGLTVNQNSLVVLSGSNTYNGGTEVEAGTLQIGAGGDTGSVAGHITNHAAVVFDRTGAASYSGILSGSGSLTKKGAGVLTLSGPNSFAGATYIEGGAVTVVPGGTLGDGSDVYLSSGAVLTANVSLAVDSLRERGSGNGGTAAIAAGAVLAITGADKATFYMGAISGAGDLALAGSGTTRMQLYGAQTYTGDTLIHSAVLGLQPDTTLASPRIVIGTNATFDVATRTGGLTFNSGQGLLILASSSNAPARINTVTNNGLVAAADSVLAFGSYSTNAGPPLLVEGAGELVLAAGNTVVVTNIGDPLVEGAYKLIAKEGNSVAGAAPTNVAVAGNGLDTNSVLTASLSIVDGELFLDVSGPTRVVLYSFTAGDENGQVVVRWRTASEEHTVGFFVERWDGRQWVRVNEAIVYAAGADGFGASYALVDAGAAAGGTYLYRLVEVETDGDGQFYGPYERTATALKLQSPVVLDGDAVLIRWLSREDECYRILRSTNLTEGFLPIAFGLPATPPENEYRDETAGGLGMYLIQVDGD
ncbi:MAG TPA: hypothetical protein DCM68_08215 [Verrucomicrobia bacterium]|nr:hypothetical protein [Verrucomicrobiota bacterium]